MKQEIKKKLPVSKEMLDKNNDKIVSEIRDEMPKKIKKELIKDISQLKEKNVLMNSNTNAHIENVKNQLANSIDSKFEYTKQRIQETKQKIDTVSNKIEGTKKQFENINAHCKHNNEQISNLKKHVLNGNNRIDEVNRKVDSANIRIDEVNRKTDRIYKFIEDFTNVYKNMNGNDRDANGVSGLELMLHKYVTNQQKEVDRRLDRIEKLLEINCHGVTQKKREKQIVVSFTSYGKRIGVVPLVLDRLFNQTLKPDRVVLYLSKENFPGMDSDLPERLLEMQQYGLEIRWCEGDIKSYKKIIPALKEFPDDIIITVDDDVYYDLDFVEKLYDSYKKHPNAISAYRVHKMLFDDERNLLSYNEWNSKCSEILNEESMQLFATGVGGILYPPHVLHEDVLNEDIFMEVCPNADDVWLKFMALLNDTPVVLVSPYSGVDYYIAGTQEDSLWKSNVSQNDIQINQLIKRYDKYFKEKSLFDRICKI